MPNAISYLHDGPSTLPDLVRRRAEQEPDRRVVRFAQGGRTYGELDTRANQVANALRDLGLGKGDRAAVMLGNGVPFLDTWFGMAKLGVVEVPINTALRGNLLAYMLQQSGSRVLVVDAAWLDRVDAVRSQLPELAHVLTVGGAPDADHPGAVSGTAPFDVVVSAASDADPGVPIDAWDRSCVLYTSGTTGPSKGVVLTHAANFRLGRTMSACVGLGTDEVLFTAFPLFHVAARYVSVLGAMLTDGDVVLHDRFSASRFWDICRQEGVTAVHYLGSLLTMLLKQPEGPAERDHTARLGYGAGAPVPVWEAVERRFGIRLYELYGMTETGAVTMNRADAYRPGSCGKVLPDCEVAIHDERDDPLPAGEVGEIVARPREPYIMVQEYLAMPEATLAAFRNLWFHTGDRGYFDADGYLYFVGRSKDAIRRRGENVSAYEVETALLEHDVVKECAVIGIDDEVSGEEIMAVLVVADGAMLTPESLLDHAQERLPHFAVPRYVRIVDALPMTPSQRVEKYKLREEGITDDTWDREAAGYEVRR
jgi:carnitine-CoA ligase